MSPAEALTLTQGSREWIEARIGFVTASRASEVIAMKKGSKEEKAERASYRMEVISERLTGEPYPCSFERARQVVWGKENEPFARTAYELRNGVLVDTVGFVMHPSIPMFGCSPDGLVGDRGMIQIKCPATRTHLEWMLGGVVPAEHCPQMLSEFACNPERIWCDFVSFDPRLPEHLQLFVVRYDRDEKMVAMMEMLVRQFNAEINQVLAALPQRQQIADVLDWPREGEVEL